MRNRAMADEADPHGWTQVVLAMLMPAACIMLQVGQESSRIGTVTGQR
jgi:hypothetical protein